MTRKSSREPETHTLSGPNRTIWELMLLRPKHRINIIAPVKKKKFRENDGESRLFSQHRWSSAYCDQTAVDAPDPPRPFHVDAMSLFKDLHEILKTLDDPSGYRFQMDSYLDWSDIHDLQNWNIRERAARRQTRAEAAHLRKLPVCHVPKCTRIMSRRLHKILLYASTPVVFHGNTHDIPIIVHSCIQELLRRGIYESLLFRKLPDPDRFTALVDIFNDGPSFGEDYRLRQENLHNVAALFVEFVVKIKDPLIVPILLDPLWYWSVKPSVKRDNVARDIQETAEEEARDKVLKDERMKDIVPREDFYYVRKPVNWTKEQVEEHEEAEGKQISAAVILLKLLPAANLSLLVYLFDFFTRIISSRRNLVEQQDIVRIFAHSVVGGKSKADAWRVMHWILDRWPRLLDGLYAERKGLTKRPAVSRPSRYIRDPHNRRSNAAEERTASKRASLERTSTRLSEGDEIVLRPSTGPFENNLANDMSRVSSGSSYSNYSDNEGEPPLRSSVFENETLKNQRRPNDPVPESQNDTITALLALMREEQARANRLERKLSARERECRVQNTPYSAHLDSESMVSQKRATSKRRREMKEKRKKNKDNWDASKEQEDIETMGQKFKAFLNARSDAQTESG